VAAQPEDDDADDQREPDGEPPATRNATGKPRAKSFVRMAVAYAPMPKNAMFPKLG